MKELQHVAPKVYFDVSLRDFDERFPIIRPLTLVGCALYPLVLLLSKTCIKMPKSVKKLSGVTSLVSIVTRVALFRLDLEGWKKNNGVESISTLVWTYFICWITTKE